MVEGLLNALLDDITLLGTTVGQPASGQIMLAPVVESIEARAMYPREKMETLRPVGPR